ncbi:DUF6348 family protein [Paucibacter sp. DJ2R-2]|uniref:DUF6348 family protein n=1 Tax=Paucibacter sp. DJ2R-2 TaxID=2893558 RepID=UPI0021E38379|nr:DUF6348 family protein [Paucibacter sp. DJ2R-2]MCV2438571.1 DUF6348 family protein [Paucibacter sp. DJ2R-2]
MRFIRRLFSKRSTPTAEPSELGDARPELTPQTWLLELFTRHGLASNAHDGWVLPKGELPAIRGTWQPGETHGRLDMQVLVRDDVVIEECFAGLGAGDARLSVWLENFTINSFHALQSCLWSWELESVSLTHPPNEGSVQWEQQGQEKFTVTS